MVRKVGDDARTLWKDNITDVPLSNGMSLRIIEGADSTLSIEAVGDTTQTLLRIESGNVTTVFSSDLVSKLVAGFVFERRSITKPSFKADIDLSLPILKRLSDVEYRLTDLHDHELLTLATVLFDMISISIVGFTRVSGKMPWELTSPRASIAWGFVDKLFELVIGASIDTVMSGLEDSELEQIRAIYGDPAKNAEAN